MITWTNDDPGAGDMGVVESWGASVLAQAKACEAVAEGLFQLSSAASNHWEGRGGTAFIGSMKRRIDRIELMATACKGAADAAAKYVGAVKVLARQAAECKGQIETARVELDALKPVVGKGFVSPAKNIALDSLHSAENELGNIAYERHTVDQVFMRDVLREMSGRIESERTEYETMDADDRQRATDASLGLLASFAGGLSPRDIAIHGGAIAIALADSGHVRTMRDKLVELLRRGDRPIGQERYAYRSLSTDGLTLASDGANVGTLGKLGNAPETVFGSFDASYEVIAVDGDEATVTFTITNDTTRDSVNRNPVVPFLQMPWAPGVNIGHEVVGGYKPIGETVVWTEVIKF